MNTLTLSILLGLCIGAFAQGAASDTRRLMLSGHGPSDAIEWNFRISDGRRAGEQAKIPVPSQWEQHGFGNYDYGSVPAKDKHKEDGFYQRGFSVPEEWRGMRVRVVFEGSMTDTTVAVNGKEAGPIHQGGFYRFHYDITDKVFFRRRKPTGRHGQQGFLEPDCRSRRAGCGFLGLWWHLPTCLARGPATAIDRVDVD
jgi:hypothetical protein